MRIRQQRLASNRRSMLAIIVFLSLALLVNPLLSLDLSEAGSLTVNSTADAVDAAPGDGFCATAQGECTLRAAIQEANASRGGDVITLPAGVYTLTVAGRDEDMSARGDLDVTDDLTINGVNKETTIIDANDLDRILHIVEPVAVNISHLTVRNGDADTGGGIYNQAGALTVGHVTVRGNRAGIRGGGGISSLTALTVSDSTISENRSSGLGGGGLRIEGSATISDTSINNNTSSSGGGIYNCPDAALALIDVALRENTAAFGGAIHNSGPLDMTNVIMEDNTGTIFGGALANTADLATLTNVVIRDNVSAEGGAIQNENGSVALINATLYNNIANDGDGIFNAVGNITLVNTILARNDEENCAGIPVTSLGYNLEDIDTCELRSPGDLTNLDPNLDSTSLEPVQASPAIDAAENEVCPTTDLRGLPRPADGDGDGAIVCDIGALEAPSQALAIEGQLSDCLPLTLVAYRLNNQSKQWLAFQPGAPPGTQTLREFVSGVGYLVNAGGDCTISSGPNNITLYAGWNLFGWQ